MFVYMSDVLKNRHETIIMAYLFQESPEGRGISPLTHLRVAGVWMGEPGITGLRYYRTNYLLQHY